MNIVYTKALLTTQEISDHTGIYWLLARLSEVCLVYFCVLNFHQEYIKKRRNI